MKRTRKSSRVKPASASRKKRGPGNGWQCAISLAEFRGGRGRGVEFRIHNTVRSGRGVAPDQAIARAARQVVRSAKPEIIAELLAALSSGHRLIILFRLLGGRASYQDLQKVSSLAAGPLYHHVAALRLAGLVKPKRRNQYEITRLGMRLALMAVLVPKLKRAATRKR